MTATRPLVDASRTRNGLREIRLQGSVLSLSLFPEAGGRILDLVHRPSGTNLLWQNPRVPLGPVHPGAPFEDVWAGGWDDLFPTDAPCTYEGNTMADHGDLWSGPWEWSVPSDDGELAAVELHRHSPSLPCLVEKRVELRRDAACVVVRYRLTNVGPCPFVFMFDLHVAHAVEPGSRVLLPAGSVGVEPPYVGRARGDGTSSWPLRRDPDGVEQDLSRVPAPESGLAEFLWTHDLRQGWCAVAHPSRGLGLGLAFDREVFPTVWLFADYGGWRGHHFVLTEPCTSRPGSLAGNAAAGTAARLDAGAVLETTVVATVLTDVDAEAAATTPPAGLVVTPPWEAPFAAPGSI